MPNGIKDYTIEELQNEIERQTNHPIPVPKSHTKFDWQPLIEICQNYVKDIEEKDYVRDDWDHYIYETAMTAVFGDSVWDWINNKLR